MLRVDRRRSDKAGFFTDLQLSSPTVLEMSVKKVMFLHRLSNVTEGSHTYCHKGFMKFLR